MRGVWRNDSRAAERKSITSDTDGRTGRWPPVRPPTLTTLVVFPGALGDFICFLPTLYALRDRYSGRRMTVVVQARLLSLAVRAGLADAGVALESAAVARFFVADADPLPQMAPWPIGDAYSWFGSADPVVRKNLQRLAAGVARCAPFSPPPDCDGHVAGYFLSSAGCPHQGRPQGTHITLCGRELEYADAFWRRHALAERGVLALHRGAGNIRKRWSDEGYAAVARWWRDRGGQVLEIAGPVDPEEPLARSHVVARGGSLGEVAALLARADLFLGNDSGISHLAGAVGLAGIAIFGPTRAPIWRPLGGRMVCITSSEAPAAEEPISLRGIPSSRVIRTLGLLLAARLTLTSKGADTI